MKKIARSRALSTDAQLICGYCLFAIGLVFVCIDNTSPNSFSRSSGVANHVPAFLKKMPLDLLKTEPQAVQPLTGAVSQIQNATVSRYQSVYSRPTSTQSANYERPAKHKSGTVAMYSNVQICEHSQNGYIYKHDPTATPVYRVDICEDNIDWDRWHKAFSSKLSKTWSQVLINELCAFSSEQAIITISVRRNHKIECFIATSSGNSLFDQSCLQAVRRMSDSKCLVFPQGSHRAQVQFDQRFTIAPENRVGFSPITGDRETLKNPKR